jgi:hypothetical protein
MREQLVSLTERFEFVTTNEDDIARLVADFRAFRESTVETLPADQLEWMQTPRFFALLESYERDTFTPGQAAVMAALADDSTDEIDNPSS